MIDIDTSQVRKLAATLTGAPRVSSRELRRVVQRGALNIKRDWQREWTGLQNLPALASAITYETRETALGPAAVIGPETGRRQGPLAVVAEFGTINNPPHPGGGPALQRELPRFERAVADTVEDSFR